MMTFIIWLKKMWYRWLNRQKSIYRKLKAWYLPNSIYFYFKWCIPIPSYDLNDKIVRTPNNALKLITTNNSFSLITHEVPTNARSTNNGEALITPLGPTTGIAPNLTHYLILGCAKRQSRAGILLLSLLVINTISWRANGTCRETVAAELVPMYREPSG